MNIRKRKEIVGDLKQLDSVFERAGFWRGGVEDRKNMFRVLHLRLSNIYHNHKPVELKFDISDDISEWSTSGMSSCSYGQDRNTITLRGRLSVITFLHEWAHSLGYTDENKAQEYAVWIFKRAFPEKFARLIDRSGNGRFYTSH